MGQVNGTLRTTGPHSRWLGGQVDNTQRSTGPSPSWNGKMSCTHAFLDSGWVLGKIRVWQAASEGSSTSWRLCPGSSPRVPKVHGRTAHLSVLGAAEWHSRKCWTTPQLSVTAGLQLLAGGPGQDQNQVPAACCRARLCCYFRFRSL